MSYINQQTLKTLSATYIQFAPHGDSAALTQNGNLISYTDIYDGDRPFLFDRRSGKKQLLPDTLSGAKIDPSGQWLIGRNREGALALTTLDGEEVRPLAQRKEGVRFKFLDWSADSSRILIGYIKASGSEMATIDVTSGSEVRRVALPFGDAALEMSAAFSPHGDQIAYDGPMGAARQWHVAVHSENETEATVVTAGAHNEALLGWDANPLGLMIARDHEGRWEAVRYTQTNDGCFAPTDCVKRPLGMVWQRQSNNWHGDYLHSAVDWQTNLYLVEIDESGVGLNKPISKISENLAWESRAEWFPNGQSILYAKGSGWGASRLQLVRWQNGQEEVITNLPGMMRFGGHSFEPRLAPEESAVIFQGRTTHGGEQDSAGIYSLDWQRSTISPIQQTTGLCPMNCLEWPTWVGVGLVAYTKWKNPWPSRSVVLHDLTTDTTKILFAAEQVGIAHLEGAPDASKIAWVTWNPSTSEVQIQIFARATAKVRTIAEWHQPVLTGYGQPLISLAWSPDASIIYCAQSLTENEQSISQLWAIPTDGREKQLLTQVVGEVPFGLSMNQDARRLLFSAGTQAEFQLQLLQIHHF